MKNKNGFTLIELLAIIVILGLLMAIAIPSVTKYITQSRKKTLTTTIGNYTSSLVADVNDMEYIFTDTNTIYAVPVECVEVERGGSNPFGTWSPASDSYWAYVLVQYDDSASSYTYGFTFKDSAGYGLYPMTLENLNENGSQIQTDLEFNIPKSGLYTNFVSEDIWERSGFNVNDKTVLKFYEKNNSNYCSLIRIFEVIEGSGDNIGDVISASSEKFYIIENNLDNVIVLAKNPIKMDLENPIQGGYDTTSFSSINYWADGYNIKPEYGNETFPYVFNEYSYLYSYVLAYENYLENTLCTGDVKVGLITYDQLLALGCTSTSCANTPDWVRTSAFWSGSAAGWSGIWVKHNGASFYGHNYRATDRVIRPVITIPKEIIKYN